MHQLATCRILCKIYCNLPTCHLLNLFQPIKTSHSEHDGNLILDQLQSLDKLLLRIRVIGIRKYTNGTTQSICGTKSTMILFVRFLVHITRMCSSNLSRIVTNLTYCMYAGSQSVMQTLWKHRLVSKMSN